MPLAIAALFAGLFIGFGGFNQEISLWGGSHLWCGNLFVEGEVDGAGGMSAESVSLLQADCEIARASKNSWAVTLITTGVALLVSSALLRSTPNRTS